MAKKSTTYKTQYFQKMTVSRGKRPVGEVFAIKWKGKGYFFGRVIRNDCAVRSVDTPHPWKRTPGNYLLYIYKTNSPRFTKIPVLDKHDLLLPPFIASNTGWTHGYFKPVRQDVLTNDDVLPVHCFWSDMILRRGRPWKQYFDEYGNPLRRRSDPCQEIGIEHFGYTEGVMALALGLPFKHPYLDM